MFRYVTYTSREEEHNLVVFQFYRHIYYRVSRPISEGTELKVWIGKDYATLLGLGMGMSNLVRCSLTCPYWVVDILVGWFCSLTEDICCIFYHFQLFR